jgi:hypothetical protein
MGIRMLSECLLEKVMSNQELGKKERETNELLPFLDAREWVTGETLVIVDRTENPDFICRRVDGRELGVELTKRTRAKENILWERLLEGKDYIGNYQALELMHHLLEKKVRARLARYSKRVSECVLVIQFVDGVIEALTYMLRDLEGDFVAHGFSELWLADYSGLEAYGDSEIFGLFPNHWWGFHKRPWPDRKPYG